jgi:hypothetical protein
MSVPQLLKSSPGLDRFTGGDRWGDYFGVAVDPVDDSTFWGFGELIKSDGYWTTWVSSWKVKSADTADVYALQTPKVLQGSIVSGTVDSLKAVDSNWYQTKTAAIAQLGQSTTWESQVQTNLKPDTVDYLAVKLNATGPALATEFVFLWNYKSSTPGYEAVATKPIASGMNEMFEISGDLSRFISPTGVVKVAVRALQPLRSGVMPVAFTLKVDQAQVLGMPK